MHSSNKTELLARIEYLEAQVEELRIQNDVLRSRNSKDLIIVDPNPNRGEGMKYLKNLIAASLFPLVSGIFRLIYKKIYRLK